MRSAGCPRTAWLQHCLSTLSTDAWTPGLSRHQISTPVYCTLAKQTDVPRKGSTQQCQAASLVTDKSSHCFLGQWEAGAIRQEVELVGGRQKLEGCHGKREGSVAVNVVFSGGGVGCGVLSILQGESRKGARSSYENKSQRAGCP